MFFHWKRKKKKKKKKKTRKWEREKIKAKNHLDRFHFDTIFFYLCQKKSFYLYNKYGLTTGGQPGNNQESTKFSIWKKVFSLTYIYIISLSQQTNKFWVRAMEFELFQSKFCAVTVALRRKGNDHFLWSWKLLQGGSLLLASLGHLLTMRCHPMSEYRISVLFRTSQVSGTSSPSLGQEELVSWKPWLMQCPERTRTFFNLLDQNKVECSSRFNI